MRFVMTAAAIAASGFFALASANAEPNYNPNGPAQQGNMCQVNTGGDTGYYGYVTPCAKRS
jgi:hypothetical protein